MTATISRGGLIAPILPGWLQHMLSENEALEVAYDRACRLTKELFRL